MQYDFVTLDVFTDRMFGGNPLAVLPDAQGLDAKQMQAIAREFNYSETTFVFPPEDDNHTFLFIVDARTVIDAGVNGNDARWINHSCDPNCETFIEDRRVFIKAIRTIQPGEELAYDYQIQRERGDPPDIDEIFACRCGASDCRGTMLTGPPPARARQGRGGRPDERHAHGRSARRR